MTRDHDFKQLVRTRMAQSGSTYTAARAELVQEREAAEHRAEAEHRRLVRPFFDGETLRSVPAKRKARAAVLLELLQRFEPGRVYSETEVNNLLRAAFDDVAYVRRELVDFGYLVRADGEYRLPEDVPLRDARWAHEFPEWERLWLPRFLRRSSPVEP